MKIKREDGADQDQKPRIGIVADVSAGGARRALELEKQRYPGASAWASDEEHLFKTLFQRAERPLLPAHWDVDLRGVPVQDSIFAAEGADAGADVDADADGAVVYSRSGKDYQATAALLRLIDLTSSVRATVQSGQRHKAPRVILAALQRYVRWAAWDAGHAGRRIVPNMLVAAAVREDHHHHHYAAAEEEEEEAAITAGMERRMRALARRQRDFFASSPRGTAQQEQHQRQRQQEQDQEQEEQEVQGEEEEEKEKKMMMMMKGAGCRGQPQLPVVYGLFVLNCSVVLLSVDSAKGDDAYVSFHVDMDLEDRHQSVWNALTVAIAVCLARDQLARVIDAFDELPAVS